jgi:hypothetical protein
MFYSSLAAKRTHWRALTALQNAGESELVAFDIQGLECLYVDLAESTPTHDFVWRRTQNVPASQLELFL